MKVMIAVTHLLGTGHLSRTLTLGRAFTRAGHDVLLASGGMAVAQFDHGGVELVQLPPLRSDGTNFSRLLGHGGHPADEPYLAARRDALCAALTRFGPDVLITELFPFGRRVLSGEFLALLEAARARPRPPVVLASVRDILAPPSKPSKARRADEIIARHYDAVLVHSDPRATRLEQSWPVSQMLAARLRYTGYVAPAPAAVHPDGAGSGEILVSAGGGAVGAALFRAAIGAARRMPETQWRLLVGGGGQALEGAPNTIIEPPRPDFRQMLRHAAASLSMCGYNTALDLLQAGTPAVLVPFDAGGEVEQGLRAQSLAPLPGFAVLDSADLTPRRLCETVERVMGDARRTGPELNFDGAARSVAIARELAGARA